MLRWTVCDYATLPKQQPHTSGYVHVYGHGTWSPQSIPGGKAKSEMHCNCSAGLLHQGDFSNIRQFQSKMAGGVLCLVAALCVINSCLVQNPERLMLCESVLVFSLICIWMCLYPVTTCCARELPFLAVQHY